MTKFMFENKEIIEVSDKAIAEVIKNDKRYQELTDNEELLENVSNTNFEKEIKKLKQENEKLQKEIEKNIQSNKDEKEILDNNNKLTLENEDLKKEVESLKQENEGLKKEVDDLKKQIEDLSKIKDTSNAGDNNDKVQK